MKLLIAYMVSCLSIPSIVITDIVYTHERPFPVSFATPTIVCSTLIRILTRAPEPT